MLTRRKFLTLGASGVLIATAGAAAPLFVARSFASSQPGASLAGGPRALVVVELNGGNDGLNTLIPYGDPLYYQLRPNLGIPAGQVRKLDKLQGLHPSLEGLQKLYANGRVAIVQDVAYPNPNYSHFEASDIWQSAQLTKSSNRSGWLGRYLQSQPAGKQKAASLAGDNPLALYNETTLVPAINGLDDFIFKTDDYFSGDGETRLNIARQIYQRVEQNSLAEFVRASALDALAVSGLLHSRSTQCFQPSEGYPDSDLGRQLSAVSQLLAADLDFRIFYVRLGSFDTHSGQLDQHASLLQDLGDSLAAFYADLDRKGFANQVLTMTFSEFGRRVSENGSGTDHGSAQPMFLVGGQLKPGLRGNPASLSDLDDGNLKHKLDFRQVYATILKDWLGLDPEPILGGKWDFLPLFSAAPQSGASQAGPLTGLAVPLAATIPAVFKPSANPQAIDCKAALF